MALCVKLDTFEGPLDLLLHLIEKNKVSIEDIPIADITDQYIEYITSSKTAQMDTMSEFLLMAAKLLEIKSKWLLMLESGDEEEEDPREELVQRLIEYRMYKSLSQELKDCMVSAEYNMYKAPDIPAEVLSFEEPSDLDALTEGIDAQKLHEIFLSVVKKQTDKIDPIRSGFKEIKKEEITLDQKIEDLRTDIKKRGSCSFYEILSKSRSRDEIVVTFLAVLEMMKAGEITASQDETFGDIHIRKTKA